MSLFLIINNESTANLALRKMGANYMRLRSDWQDSKGFGKGLLKKNGTRVDPATKTDDELVNDSDLVMFGEKKGQANLDDGYTTLPYATIRQRVTDSQYCIPLPDDETERGTILQGVPQPNSVEEYSPDWFPEIEE